MDSSERSDKCSRRLVEPHDRGLASWIWYPQLGGYSGHARVYFDSDCGCFDLEIYHNGDFPTDKPELRFHCCSALQYVHFGLDVYEAQGQPDESALLAIRDRIDAIMGRETE